MGLRPQNDDGDDDDDDRPTTNQTNKEYANTQRNKQTSNQSETPRNRRDFWAQSVRQTHYARDTPWTGLGPRFQSQVDQPAILGRDGQPACGTRYTTQSMHRTVASASLPPAEALARWGEACLSSAPAWSPACPDGVARDEAEAAPRRRCTARRHLLTQCRTARVVQSSCNSLSTSSPSKSSCTTA